jgi:hypothetical protein
LTAAFRQRVQCLCGALPAALALVLAGCNHGPTIVPVSGQICIDGQPLTTGFITVYQDGYRPATAEIQSGGRFTFKTLNSRDGCLLGEHAVTVQSNKMLSASSTKFFVPDRYGDIGRSDVKIKIDGPQDELVIDLTWRGSGHSEPYVVNTGSADEGI